MNIFRVEKRLAMPSHKSLPALHDKVDDSLTFMPQQTLILFKYIHSPEKMECFFFWRLTHNSVEYLFPTNPIMQ